MGCHCGALGIPIGIGGFQRQECQRRTHRQVPQERTRHHVPRTARAYQYHGPMHNDYVFGRLYYLAASECQRGVANFFLDVFRDESLFDVVPDRMTQSLR
eukprot:5372129-Pyramimonas_sp.AAC.1